MRKHHLLTQVRKRLLACALVACLAVPNTGMPIFASSTKESTLKHAHYNEALLREIQKLCPEGQYATDILDALRMKGLIDETGEPVENNTFLVDGKKMSTKELEEEAKKHQTGKVLLDDTEVAWEKLNRLFEIKASLKEIQRLQEFTDKENKIDESRKDEYIANIQSLREQLAAGDVKVYDDPSNSTYGAGICHQVRVSVTPAQTTLTETGEEQKLSVQVSMVLKQSVPVTFSYHTVSGTAKAEGDGEVTIPAGETSASFEVVYKGNAEQRNGKRLFFIECNQIQNALFDDGVYGGKNITIPITVEKNDTYCWEHDVSGTITQSEEVTIREEEDDGAWWNPWDSETIEIPQFHRHITCTITYENLLPWINHWPDNIYEYSYSSHPSFDTGGVSVYGTSGNDGTNIGRKTLPTDSRWSFTVTGMKEKARAGYTGGVSSNMHIREVHERVTLTGLLYALKEESEEGANDQIQTEQYKMKDSFITKEFHVETDELSLTAQLEDKQFSYYGTDNLIWVSSDETIANVQCPEEYEGEKASSYGEDNRPTVNIIPTGKAGNVYFTLYALNESLKGFNSVEVCRSVMLHCEPGNTPFLKIPSARKGDALFTCKRNDSLDISFMSNLTQQNSEEAEKLSLLGEHQLLDYPTKFTIKVYNTDFAGNPIGEPVYTANEFSQ